MTVVYRAYSPSRDHGGWLCEYHSAAQGRVSTLNQNSAVTGDPADWVVQTGHIQWEQA